MAAPSVSLSTSAVTVVPGGEASCDVLVRNNGSVVDQLQLEVLGDAAGWAAAEPPALSLFPGAEGTATVRFRPPRSPETPAGAVPFAVRVASREDPAGSRTEEGTVEVLPFTEVTAALLPRTSHGSSQAVHEVAIDNQGNAPASVAVNVADPDQRLLFSVEPPASVVDPGGAQFVKVKVRPRKRILRGQPVNHQFVAEVEEDGRPPVQLHGGMVQTAVVPRWAPRAAAAAVLGVAGLALLWALLLQPAVESAAREAVEDERPPVTIASPGGGGGGGSGSGGDSGGSGDGSGGSGDDGAAGGGLEPFDRRLALTEPGAVSFEVPAGKQLQLTDVVLQNPAGESGRLEIRRDDAPLVVTELANFRDLDYHFVAPIVFTAGQRVVLAANCSSPTCTPGAYLTGYLVDA